MKNGMSGREAIESLRKAIAILEPVARLEFHPPLQRGEHDCWRCGKSVTWALEGELYLDAVLAELEAVKKGLEGIENGEEK